MNPHSEAPQHRVISHDRLPLPSLEQEGEGGVWGGKCFMFSFECLSVYLCTIVSVKAHLAC